MTPWLSLLPQIILAQALGVVLAWRVDASTRNFRSMDDKSALSVFISVLVILTPLFYLHGADSYLLIPVFLPLLLWLVIVACIQKKQHSARYFAAFVGAFVQFSCSALALIGILMCFAPVVEGNVALSFFITSTFTYALLSLFRPTITTTLNTFRQFARKNRPMR